MLVYTQHLESKPALFKARMTIKRNANQAVELDVAVKFTLSHHRVAPELWEDDVGMVVVGLVVHE